jgi:hypothetical protein
VSDIDKWKPSLYLTVCCYNILDHEQNEQANLPNTFMNDDDKLLNYLFQGNKLTVYLFYRTEVASLAVS